LLLPAPPFRRAIIRLAAASVTVIPSLAVQYRLLHMLAFTIQIGSRAHAHIIAMLGPASKPSVAAPSDNPPPALMLRLETVTVRAECVQGLTLALTGGPLRADDALVGVSLEHAEISMDDTRVATVPIISVRPLFNAVEPPKAAVAPETAAAPVLAEQHHMVEPEPLSLSIGFGSVGESMQPTVEVAAHRVASEATLPGDVAVTVAAETAAGEAGASAESAPPALSGHNKRWSGERFATSTVHRRRTFAMPNHAARLSSPRLRPLSAASMSPITVPMPLTPPVPPAVSGDDTLAVKGMGRARSAVGMLSRQAPRGPQTPEFLDDAFEDAPSSLNVGPDSLGPDAAAPADEPSAAAAVPVAAVTLCVEADGLHVDLPFAFQLGLALDKLAFHVKAIKTLATTLGRTPAHCLSPASG
jgi:hypothetical protein